MKFKSLIFIVLAASMTCTDIYAENNRPIDIALWENGPLEKNDDEGKAYDENVRIYRPSIKVFLPEGKNTGRAVIMCPGGGYALLAYDHEGYAYADYFKHQGIALIVLKYRMPHGNHKVPMSDVCAGGHLASTFATHYPAELRPAFQILVYPVISMDETITHSGSRENLIGKNPSKALIDYYSNEKHVNAESPRAFIALSNDDRAVPVENSLRYYKALHRYQIPVSLHIYPTGGHGWGYNESFRFKKAVHDELSDWLRSF